MYGGKGSKPAGKVVAPNKLWHAFKHKNLDVFKLDLDAEEDQNYVSASERFLELQTQAMFDYQSNRRKSGSRQADVARKSMLSKSVKLAMHLGMVLHHTTLFRKTLEESLQQAVELADDFARISSGQGGGRPPEQWASTAGKQAFFLKGMLEESVESLRQHLQLELEEKVVRSLREEVAAFSTVHNQMNERANMKVEMLHYSKKLEELRGMKNTQKNHDEKMERNKEKYAQASQALRDQTNQLMSVFAHAEQVRQKLLTTDLPSVISSERDAFDAFSINLTKASAEAMGHEARPQTSVAAHVPHRSMPSDDFPTTPPGEALADVSLDDNSPQPPHAFSNEIPSVKMEPPPPYGVQQTIVKKRSPSPMSPNKSGAPWAGGANGGGEFGQELKRAHEHQNSKMAAESVANAAATMATAATAMSSAEPTADTTPERTVGTGSNGGGFGSGGAGAASSAGASAPVGESGESSLAGTPDSPTPELPETRDGDEVGPPDDGSKDSRDIEDEVRQDGPIAHESEETEEEEMGELEPGKVRVRALYDYDATQDGDLSFSVGDIIVTDGGAFAGDGWVSGECHGNTGIFPANYTEPY